MPRRLRPVALVTAASLTAAAFFLACGDASGPVEGPSLARKPVGVVVKVLVTPSSATLQPGGTVQLTAQALDRRNKPVVAASFTWSSAAPGVAAVSPAGVVTAIAAGSTVVSATSAGVSGSATIGVTAPPPAGGAVLLAAGDIAQCNSTNDEATAALLDTRTGTIAVLGDNVYENGSLAEYTNCYGPSWGRHKVRTAPSVGNHEYGTAGAAGYWDYWGAAAGERGKGYYSYDLGAWHIVVLNSNCSFVSCAAGSPQEQWLRADLAGSSRACTLAYWHHPRFNSGASHGNNTAVQPLWQALYDFGADVILNGHEHIYERFAPQTPTGAADPARGIRQFTVGSGGRSFYSIGVVKPNSEVRRNDTHGILALSLADGGYSWAFVPVAGKTFTDTGSASCH